MAESLIGIKPLHDRVLVGIYDDGDTTIMLGGKKFILLDDTSFAPDLKRNRTNETHKGIRPRYAIVLATSDRVAEHGNIRPGDKVLLAFGEWTRAISVRIDGETTKVWSIPTTEVMGTLGHKTFDETELDQIKRLYPDWEKWETETI